MLTLEFWHDYAKPKYGEKAKWYILKPAVSQNEPQWATMSQNKPQWVKMSLGLTLTIF